MKLSMVWLKEVSTLLPGGPVALAMADGFTLEAGPEGVFVRMPGLDTAALFPWSSVREARVAPEPKPAPPAPAPKVGRK